MDFNEQTISKIRNFITDWDNSNPIDFWWRMKFNVPFGSKRHLEVDFIDQQISYEEEKLLKELSEKEEATGIVEYTEDGERVMKSDDERVVKMTEKEITKWYDDIDLSK